MRKTSLIGSTLADESRGSEVEECSTARPHLRKRAGDDEDGADAVLFFERGVIAMGQQKVAALELATSESHLADYLRGDKTIAFHRVVRMCRKNQDAALAILTELSRIAGLAPPQKIEVELTPAQKKEARQRFVRHIRTIRLLHSATVQQLADEMGVDAEAVDSALDEVTDVRQFAK